VDLAKILNVLGPIILGIAVVGFVIIVRRTNSKTRYLQKKGISGVGKILKISDTLIKLGTGSFAQPVMEVILEVQGKESNTVAEVSLKQAFQTSDIPKVGDLVNILIDPNNRSNVMIEEREAFR
jgi:hypothetical protein